MKKILLFVGIIALAIFIYPKKHSDFPERNYVMGIPCVDGSVKIVKMHQTTASPIIVCLTDKSTAEVQLFDGLQDGMILNATDIKTKRHISIVYNVDTVDKKTNSTVVTYARYNKIVLY